MCFALCKTHEMTTKGGRIKSTTSSAPNNTVKKTDTGINYVLEKNKKLSKFFYSSMERI